MTKKLLAMTLVLLMIVPVVYAKNHDGQLLPADNRTQILVPGTARQIPANLLESRKGVKSDDLEIVRFKGATDVERKSSSVSPAEDVLWTLMHVDNVAEYYLSSGSAADTFAVVFTPAAPAVVQNVYAQWFSPGNVNAFGADYSAAAAALSPSGIADDDDAPVSPIGAMRTTITPNTIAGDFSWEALDIGGTFTVGDSNDLGNVPNFVIGYAKGGDLPQPLADATSDQGGISYTWFGGPWTDHEWGDYNPAVDLMMFVEVTYPWGAPVAIQSLSQVNNSYSTTGPFTVAAYLFDDTKDGFAINEDDSLTYHWTLNGASEMTGPLTADAIETNGNGYYTFDIAGSFMPGDEIEYWITIIDNDGLPSESISLSFEIKAPSQPTADLLIVHDGDNDSQLANMFYESVAADLGIVFEYWNTVDEQGIDASVVNHGWDNIVVYGWGTTAIPVTDQDDNGFGAFLDNGGNLVLVDQDWMFGHGLDQYTNTFAAGDFAFDYFGIASGENDPDDDDGNATGDTSFYGLGSTAMELPFLTEPIVLDHAIYGTQSWADIIGPGAATAVFEGENDAEVYGVTYEPGAFRTAYFSFMADAAVDTTDDGNATMTSYQFDDFFSGVLEWMGVSSPPLIENVTPEFAGTSDPSARTVEATITDFDGEAITADLVYSLDGGISWVEAPMTATGDVFSADLPALTASGWVVYYISAEDASGAVTEYPDANSFALSFYYLSPVNDILLVDATYGYGSYFNGAYYDAFGNLDLWSMYSYGDPDASVFTTTNYSTIVVNAEYVNAFLGMTTEGHALEAFVAAGGNLIVAGDEVLGNYYGWGGPVWFDTGDIMADWFGVSGAWTDAWEYADSLEGVAGTLTDGLVFPSYSPLGTDYRDQVTVGEFDISETSGTGGGTGTVDTLMITQSAWYGSAYNSGTAKAVFMPIYLSGLDAATVLALGDAIKAYLDDATVPTGVEGIIGPESGDYFEETVGRDNVQLVSEFALHNAYPNPFNPMTNIRFDVPHTSDVVVSVYNMLGQKVVELTNATYSQGVYNITWNGTDANGNAVGSGLYIYHMQAGGFSETNKMLYLK